MVALDRLGRDGSGPIGGLGSLADSAPYGLWRRRCRGVLSRYRRFFFINPFFSYPNVARSSNLARGSLRGPALAGSGVGSGLGGVGGGGETGRLSDVPAGEEYQYQYSGALRSARARVCVCVCVLRMALDTPVKRIELNSNSMPPSPPFLLRVEYSYADDEGGGFAEIP